MASDRASPPTVLVIHGGAGVIERDALEASAEAAIHAALQGALDAGQALLSAGGSALDAVEAAVVALEESPHFNAGKGSVYDADGGHELDASIMDGVGQRAGAVAGVTTVRNPVRLARRVMTDSPHVLLIGAGAERFADTQADLERVPNAWFDTPHRHAQLLQAQAREAAERAQSDATAENLRGKYFGTVGAVALDADGRLAAATSTGGMTNKKWGRVGDSPVIGAGTWADARCAVSGTGWGEFFLRAAVAHDIAARIAYGGHSLQAAADAVICDVVPALGGDGGAIAVDRDGNIAMPFSTSGMYRGWVRGDGRRGTAIFRDV
ncbi:isoaspartyl peptidase/L-asparaginase [Luteimonas sp. BDR2-5]|uniref:isoaspartyl peptidase/L-asparaginase family protein n=1 Tax=Proluteimonas luteida TaxID=2878685 RepID=UPI001E400ABA|nr:isoaspartyl peptidase/L-asparaginase [Luteimonas sp. BDR2-5]MCD9028899.1 isoaspartyl peptidase/L-asparaginase [Luteimonas sp. BDR2-5]